ncbi:MAG: hypothetical protein NWQ26_03305 [Paraglaciecola sp.]|nr:hypothetical protein [Paraglaciecola sp.]
MFLRLFIFLLSILLLSACAKEQVAEPMCRIDKDTLPAPAAPASCLITSNTSVLVLKLKNKNGWQLPTGYKNNKMSAQCTAHQAVWQSTGLNVEVGQLLDIAPDNKHIYSCALSNGFDTLTQDLPVPDWAHRKVVNISFADPNLTPESQWSEKSDLILIRSLFNKGQ